MKCKVEDCQKNSVARQLCSTHYGAFYRESKNPNRLKRKKVSFRDVQGFKQCTRCLVFKSEESFSKSKHASDGLYTACKSCDNERVSKTPMRHGLTKNQILALLEKQNFSCSICMDAISFDTLATDHDHKHCNTKQGCLKCVRGLLCRGCNWGLGHFKDSPTMLRAAAEYLEKFSVSACETEVDKQ